MAFASISPGWYTWGASGLRVLNRTGLVVVLMSMGIILVPSFRRILLYVFETGISKYQKKTSAYKWSFRILGVLLLSACFWSLHQKLFFLGDGYLLLRNLPLINSPVEVFGFYKNEPLSGFVVYAIATFFKSLKVNDYPLAAYQSMSILSGICSVVLIFKISKYLVTDTVLRILLAVGFFSSVVAQMFFSYVENYSIGIAISSLYIYVSLRFLVDKKSLAFATLAFIFLVFSHYGMILAGVSYAYLVYREFIRRRYTSIAVNLSMVCAAIIFLYFSVYNKYPGLFSYVFMTNNHLLIDQNPGSIEYSYSFFGPYHLIDLSNLILFIFPYAIFLIPFALNRSVYQRIFSCDKYVFLCWASIGTFLFVPLMKSDLGLSRDWDLYALFLFPSIILILLAVVKLSTPAQSKQNVTILILVTFIQSMTWVYVNSTKDLSLNYFNTLPNEQLWSKKAIAHTMDELGSYYDKMGNHRESLNYNLKYLQYDSTNIRIIENVASTYYYWFFDLKNAESWYRKAIEYQSKAWEVYNNLAEIGIREHNYLSALELLDKSIQYNPQSPLPKLNKAFILASVNNQKQEALAIYDDILKTNPDNTNALLNAGYLSYQMKGYSNTKKYLGRYVTLAPRDPETPKIQELLRSLE